MDISLVGTNLFSSLLLVPPTTEEVLRDGCFAEDLSKHNRFESFDDSIPSTNTRLRCTFSASSTLQLPLNGSCSLAALLLFSCSSKLRNADGALFTVLAGDNWHEEEECATPCEVEARARPCEWKVELTSDSSGHSRSKWSRLLLLTSNCNGGDCSCIFTIQGTIIMPERNSKRELSNNEKSLFTPSFVPFSRWQNSSTTVQVAIHQLMISRVIINHDVTYRPFIHEYSTDSLFHWISRGINLNRTPISLQHIPPEGGHMNSSAQRFNFNNGWSFHSHWPLVTIPLRFASIYQLKHKAWSTVSVPPSDRWLTVAWSA